MAKPKPIEIEEIEKTRKGFFLRNDTIADIDRERAKLGSKGITAARFIEILVQRYMDEQEGS